MIQNDLLQPIRKKTRKNPDLEKLLNPKSPLDSLKNKWQTDTTKCSTESKAYKSLITDLDTSTKLINQAGGPPSIHKTKEIQTKGSKAWKQENGVTHRTLDSQSHANNIRLPSKQTIKHIGTRKPHSNFMLLQDIHDCVCRKTAYHTRLSYRATCIYKVLYATMYNKNPHI